MRKHISIIFKARARVEKINVDLSETSAGTLVLAYHVHTIPCNFLVPAFP